MLEGKILSLFEVAYLKTMNHIDYLKSLWNNNAEKFYSNFYVLEGGGLRQLTIKNYFQARNI